MIPECLRTGFSTCDLKTKCGPPQSVGSPSRIDDLMHIPKYMGNKNLGKSEKRIIYFDTSALYKRCIRSSILRRLIICNYYYYYYSNSRNC